MKNEVAAVQWSEPVERALKSLRKPGQGVVNIVKFNWPVYLLALVVIFGCQMAVPLIPDSLMVAFLAVYFLAVNWFGLSLFVSYLVYDLSDLYQFKWLLLTEKGPPQHILNLHAGFDETSKGMQIIFPEAEIVVLDFYSRERSTEPSIARARASRAGEKMTAMPAESVDVCGWKIPDRSQDLVQLFMAAHELRKQADREALFREVHRVLKPDGEVIIVEHMRDFANFVAFGPGCMHFFPRSQWLKLASQCGFCVRKEESLLIFVRVFHLCKR